MDLSKNPIHLGLDATAGFEPTFTGAMEWYQAYSQRHDEKDGKEGRLVTLHTFSEPWTVWERHPVGAEVVLVTAGEMTLVQDIENKEFKKTKLTVGQAAINPPNVWHTADVDSECTALFITAGMGTDHKERKTAETTPNSEL